VLETLFYVNAAVLPRGPTHIKPLGASVTRRSQRGLAPPCQRSLGCTPRTTRRPPSLVSASRRLTSGEAPSNAPSRVGCASDGASCADRGPAPGTSRAPRADRSLVSLRTGARGITPPVSRPMLRHSTRARHDLKPSSVTGAPNGEEMTGPATEPQAESHGGSAAVRGFGVLSAANIVVQALGCGAIDRCPPHLAHPRSGTTTLRSHSLHNGTVTRSVLAAEARIDDPATPAASRSG